MVYFKGSIVGPWPAVIQRAKVFQPPPDSSSYLSLSSFFLHLPCFYHLPSPLAKMFIPSPPTKSFSQKLFSPRYLLASSLHPRFTPVIADPVTRLSLPQCLLPCTCSLFLVTNIIVTISTSTSAYQPPSYPSVHATSYQQPLLPFILYFGKSLSTSMTFVCFSLTVHMCVCV